ncbi:MAG: TRCF domain-containing protein [Candidatus Eisenbacteria bacterium]
MNLYKSLADAKDLAAVEAIAAEMNDRFGKHPEAVRHLLGLRRVRLLAAANDVDRVIVRLDQIQLDMLKDLKKKQIEMIVRRVPFQVEFDLHGTHRVRARKPREGPISAALILLRALEEASA